VVFVIIMAVKPDILVSLK